MGKGQGIIRSIVSVLVAGLAKEARREVRRSTKSASQPAPRSSGPKPRLRTQTVAAGAGASGASAVLDSPGRSGGTATRELDPAAVRGLKPSYAPAPDGNPDPGEIVWTWVPYVENDGRGKDRPVLIIARLDAHTTAGCYLSTKQHRGFVPIGSGGWDPQGRESFLSPERVLRISDEGMRREGHVLARGPFDAAVAAISALHGIRG
ncbi:type II toxin-antitoxin system PemK/MazF family toxin [Leucobacter sp. gxy201]|uniref:type II toxin-antitoxin system PemK/MazF family toxin n=1 Tax=Leucobacter sp. gxy201 TaxID=2957200 RepID=UPI003DA1B164